MECLSAVTATIEIIESVFTILAIIGAGIWALYVYLRQRENHPHIEFSAEIIIHSKVKDHWIVELIAYIENKGRVRHKMHNLNFNLAFIKNDDSVSLAPQFSNQVLFPHELINEGSYLPNGREYFFVDPGVKSKYSHITRVPIEADTIIFHTTFNYNDGKSYHAAEATKKVPD